MSIGKIAIVTTLIGFILLGSFFAPVVNASSGSHLYGYTVQSGDTLYSLGVKFGVSWQSIASQNNIQYPYTISVGEKLQIPLNYDSVTYTVRSGDTLSTIGQSYEVSWQTIASANSISYPYVISVGEKLQIPLIIPSCTYQGKGGADGSGWWCWTSETSLLQKQGLSIDLSGTASYFGVCPATLEEDNGFAGNAPIWNGEEIAIPNHNGCPTLAAQSWVWLWENYASGLQEIKAHPGALTVVSPNTYYLFNNGTFGIESPQAEVCSQVHSLNLQCDPMIQNDQSNPAGINALLKSASLQADFIQNALSTAVNSNLDGYNVDFEPSSGIQYLAPQYGNFLTNFANAMHSKDKTLSVDVAAFDGGALWNLTIEAKSTVDLILTMTTYSSSYSQFQQGLQTMLSNVPVGKIAIGFLTVSDDSTLAQRMSDVEAANVHCIMVWPSGPSFLSNIWWGNLTSYQRYY